MLANYEQWAQAIADTSATILRFHAEIERKMADAQKRLDQLKQGAADVGRDSKGD